MSQINLRGRNIVALSGGVGGAKLALGLAKCLAVDELNIVTNTGDDFNHLGMRIAPDLDTVMYTLAELNNRELGWGLAGETWSFMEAIKQLNGETWFQLGDRDLATHVMRSQMISDGHNLSKVTKELCSNLGVRHSVIPMSDDPVSTRVHTDGGELAFQHYFVREQCEPVVTGFHFEGIEQADPSEGFVNMLDDDKLAAVIICPSNPFVSIDPILSLRGVRQKLSALKVPVIAVSPIIGGRAIKGPTAKMMRELSLPLSAVSVAEHYKEVINAYVLDQEDVELKMDIENLGMQVLSTNTVMNSLQDRIDLASDILSFMEELSREAIH